MNENQQEMYQYLLDHAYVSHTKKDPFRQREMTETRAKCIACKCGNMIDEKTKELQERIDKAIDHIKNHIKSSCGMNLADINFLLELLGEDNED